MIYVSRLTTDSRGQGNHRGKVALRTIAVHKDKSATDYSDIFGAFSIHPKTTPGIYLVSAPRNIWGTERLYGYFFEVEPGQVWRPLGSVSSSPISVVTWPPKP